jgi:hypothetical protein
LERATNQLTTNRDFDEEQLCTSFSLIVQSARSFTGNQSNAMALKKVLNSQLMSGLLNAWDVAHLASS